METMRAPDGATVEALIEGDGDEAVVFVHASASGISQWRAYQQALSDRYTTAAVHLHGYGATTPWDRRRRQRLADQAGLVGTVIQAIGRPTHLVGHSFGGAVALGDRPAVPGRRRVGVRVRTDGVLGAAVRGPRVLGGDLGGGASGQDRRGIGRPRRRRLRLRGLLGPGQQVWERMSDRQQASAAAAMVNVAHEADALMSPPADPERVVGGRPRPDAGDDRAGQSRPGALRSLASSWGTGDGSSTCLTEAVTWLPVTDPAAVLAALRPFLDRWAPSRPLIASTASS